MSSIEDRLDRLNEGIVEATASLRRSREMLSRSQEMFSKVKTKVRNDALEEAAKVLDDCHGSLVDALEIAAVIRALKEPTDG